MVTQQLLDFIKSQMQSGLSRDGISQLLASQGWAISDINEAFATLALSAQPVPHAPVAPSPVPPSPPAATIPAMELPIKINTASPKNSDHGRGIAVTIIILIVLAVAGFWFFNSALGQKIINEYRPTAQRTISIAEITDKSVLNYGFNMQATIATSTPHIVQGFAIAPNEQDFTMTYANNSTVVQNSWTAHVIAASGTMYGQDPYDGSYHNVNNGIENRLPISESSFNTPQNLLGLVANDNSLTMEEGTSTYTLSGSLIATGTSPYEKITKLSLGINKTDYDVVSFDLTGIDHNGRDISASGTFSDFNQETGKITVPTTLNPFGDFLARETLILNVNQGKSFDYLWPLWEKTYFNCTQCVDQMADADNDGLNNVLEFLYGSNPTKSPSGPLQVSDLAAVEEGLNPVTGNPMPAAYASTTSEFINGIKFSSLGSPIEQIGKFTLRAPVAKIPIVFESTTRDLALQYSSDLPAGDYITVFIGNTLVDDIVLNGPTATTRIEINVDPFAGTTNDLSVILNPFGPTMATSTSETNFNFTITNLKIEPYNTKDPFVLVPSTATVTSAETGIAPTNSTAPPVASQTSDIDKGQVDCGNETYPDSQTETTAMTNSTCFNTTFKTCSYSTMTGIVGDTINTFAVVGPKANMCEVTLTYIDMSSGNSASWDCLFDPAQPFSVSNDAIEKYCTAD